MSISRVFRLEHSAASVARSENAAGNFSAALPQRLPVLLTLYAVFGSGFRSRLKQDIK
jgi:hypothetical protein